MSENILKNKYTHFLNFLRRWSKELTVALVLAILVAIGIGIYEKKIDEYRLHKNQDATAKIMVYDKENKLLVQGSGVFIKPNGTLVTNYHVIEKGDITKTEARLPSGAYYKAKGLWGINKKLDIAILQFDATDNPYVKGIGDSDKILSGQEVIAIGSPLGLENSTSRGVIANPSRQLNGHKFIQFTAPISSGSSGGGLFNKTGDVIGVLTSTLEIPEKYKGMATAQNLNFAVPINVVKEAINGTNKNLTEQSADYYYSLGQIEENANNNEKAIDLFNKAILLDKNYANAYVELGGIYYDRGQYNLEVVNITVRLK